MATKTVATKAAADPKSNSSKTNKYKNKALPRRVYAVVEIGGKNRVIAMRKDAADYFDVPNVTQTPVIEGSDGVRRELSVKLRSSIKVPKETNAKYAAKSGKAQKHDYHAMSVSAGLRNEEVENILQAVIKNNKPDYFVTNDGIRRYIAN